MLLSAQQIADRVEALAASIAADIDTNWCVMAIMDGAFVFAADLMRAFHARGLNLEFDSLCLSSYQDSHESSQLVRLQKLQSRDVTGKNILIVDDIFETGHTIHFAIKHLKDAGCGVVKTCVFANKTGKRMIGSVPDYIGWEAPDQFLVGYGLDDKGRYRGQPFISAISAP